MNEPIMATAKRRRAVLLAALIGMALLLYPVLARASEAAVSVADVTAPTGSVELAPGETGNITINISVTGNQAGTATFEVYRDWTLSGGTFTGSNPQEFTVFPRAGGDPATTFSTSGTVTVAAGHAPGTFTLTVGVFDITNSNATGAKLAAGDAGTYQVIVVEPAPSDTTAPVITPNITGTLGDNGWYTSDVTVTWNVVDNESAITSTTGCGPTTINADTTGTTLTCTATSDGGTSSESVTIKRDATDPMISGSASPAPNANGWNNTDVDVTFICNDATSGIASCGPDVTLSSEGAGQSATGTAVDNAGNTAQATVSGINIDKTPPTISWSGSINDGDTFYWGFVPASPTCTASDALSGEDGCSVTGYSTAVGTHTLTATGRDRAGNETAETRSYTVLAWDIVLENKLDLDPGAYNVVKGGSTVPLKFRLFAGATEITDTSYITFAVINLGACDGGGTETPVDYETSGNTSLRYDSDDQHFIQNWKTPRNPGGCYRVEISAGGATLSALFKLK